MTANSDREALADLFATVYPAPSLDGVIRTDDRDREFADRLLASDWLADHDAAIRKEAREAALLPIRALVADMRSRGVPGATDSVIDTACRRQIREDVKRIEALIEQDGETV